jgi:serine/threonine-protein kinase
MAPEQLEHQEVDRRVDVWATAVVLWEALTGQRLFNGDHPARVMKAVLTNELPKPSDIAADVPTTLDDVVMKGLAREPSERWSSAREMAVALEASGCVATQHAISQWVERVAAESLAMRSDRIAEIEGTALTGPNVGVPPPRPELTTLPTEVTFAATDRDIRDPAPTRKRNVLIGVAALAVLCGGIAIGSKINTQPGAPAAGSTSAPTTPPLAAPTPEPTPAPVPPAATPSPSAKPTATHAPTTKPTTKPTVKHPPSKACDPPYTVGKDGVKKPKLECL